MFVLTDAAGLGAGDIDSNGAFVDRVAIANDTGLGLDAEAPGAGRRRVTYAPTVTGVAESCFTVTATPGTMLPKRFEADVIE